MRKVLLAICIAGLLQSAARAELLGAWVKTTSGANTIYTLTVTRPPARRCMGSISGSSTTSAGPAANVDQGDGTFAVTYATAGIGSRAVLL